MKGPVREGSLPHAAFLLVTGFQLLGTESDPNNNRRMFWVFDDPQGASSQALLAYANGAMVRAADFAAAQQKLKSALRGGAR